MRLAPVQVSIPRLNVRVTPTPTGLAADNRSLSLPDSARTVVWWAYGATPGSTTGTVLLAGHISWAGRLGDPQPDRRACGWATRSTSRAATARSSVTRSSVAAWCPKRSLADLGLFQDGGPARLVLVTCGGRFDAARHSYEDNIVVQAAPD